MLLSLLIVALQTALPADSTLTIVLAHGTPAEVQTRVQLERLLAEHDTSPWQFTSEVVIDASAIPHSHPRLTLHTRHLRDDDLLLSTYLHEQLHWFLSERDSAADAAVRDLRRLFPTTPVGHPEGGSDETSNYHHLLVIYLEDRANRTLLGELRAHQILEFWANDHYTWIYQTVRDRGVEIGRVVRDHGLLFPPGSR